MRQLGDAGSDWQRYRRHRRRLRRPVRVRDVPGLRISRMGRSRRFAERSGGADAGGDHQREAEFTPLLPDRRHRRARRAGRSSAGTPALSAGAGDHSAVKECVMSNTSADIARAKAYAMPLADINVSDPSLFEHDTVWPYFERLRREDPVHYCAQSCFGAYWSIVKYKDIMHVDTNHGTFSSEARLGGPTLIDGRDCSGATASWRWIRRSIRSSARR